MSDKKYAVEISFRAENDIDEAYEWMLENYPEFAQKWYKGLYE